MSPTSEARDREHEAQFGRARDGVAVLSPDWRIRYANASLLEILDLLGGGGSVQTFWDAIPGWDRVPEADELRRAMRDRIPILFRFDRRPEVPHVWEVAAEPLDRGELRVRLRNVTAQAQVEDLREANTSLAERERRLADIVAGAPVSLALLDARTLTFLEANADYLKLLDAPWDEPGAILGHPIGEVLPDYHENGVHHMLEQVRQTGQAFESEEFPFHGFRRGPAWFRLTVKPIRGDAAEGVRYLLILAVEVTSLVQGRHRVEAERLALFDVLDTLPVGVLVAEAPSGRTTYLNPTAVLLGGRTPDELSAGDLHEYTRRWRLCRPTGEPFPTRELPLARALAGEVTREVEVVLRLPDGGERTLLVSGVPLRDAAGRVERGMVAFYDITDRLRLERDLIDRTRDAEHAAANAALREEESRALREMGRALVSSLEPEDVLRLAGQHAMELLGARGSFFAAPVPGTDEVRVAPALGLLGEMEDVRTPLSGSAAEIVLREGTQAYNDLEQLPAASPLRPMMHRVGARNLLLVPVRAYGEAVGVLGVVDRVDGFGPEEARLLEAFADSAALAVHNARLYAAERTRAEANRALLRAAEVLTSTLDPAEVMERMVSLAVELVGADGAGLTLFQGPADQELRMAVATGMLEPLRGLGGASEGTLTEQAFAQGTPTVFSAAETPHRSLEWMRRLGVEHYAVFPLRAGGERLGMLGLVRGADRPPFTQEELGTLGLLGDQAALAVRNARLYESAQSASRAKSEFVAVMSHELRTPLNALAGFSSLLEEGVYGPLNPEQLAALRRMRSAREHLLALIDQVLDVARVEAGTRRARPEPVVLPALVREVGEALRGAAQARGLSLDVRVTAGVALAETDPGLVRQILTNLIGNAVKFTEQGGITVRLHPCEGDACIEVADTGPGIPADLQERVFEPFYQADPSTTRREGGVGLGLALSREFARLLGGDLSLRSAPGEGSTFTLRLPAATEVDG